MLELLLGQIFEAIYFALFMIFAKRIKEKRLLFIVLMIFEYLLWIYIFKYNFIFHIGFIFTTYIILKILYKEKSQITDIFIMLVAYLIMTMFSLILYPIIKYNYYIALIINRTLMIMFFILFRKKLYKIQNLYKKLWNRNDKRKSKIKSTTFRAINLIIFNTIFYVLNLCMLYSAFLLKK